jgi:hypothetical protein
MMDRSGAASGVRSVLVTNGSGCGSVRPKNIQIRMRIPFVHLYFSYWSRFVVLSGWKRAGVEGPGGSGHPQDGVCQHHTQQHPLYLQVRILVGNKHNCPAGSGTFLTPGSGIRDG